MSACCCVEPDWIADFVDTREIKAARVEHQCCECLRVIPVGAPYRRESGVGDGSWFTYKTCALCAAVRDDRMECGFIWGGLWESIAECEWYSGEDDELDGWLDPPDWPIEVRV